MSPSDPFESLSPRRAPLEMSPEEFRKVGHELVDAVAGFLESLPSRPVSRDASPRDLRALLPSGGLPQGGRDAGSLVQEAYSLLVEHSLFNGHPRFFGYITSSAAPIGALADLLAASVNPNLGGWQLSPMATEIERQCVRWIAEMLEFPVDCGGLLVSGGNMANFAGFLAARRAGAGESVRERGIGAHEGRLTAYASAETHTWIQKAADLFGLGTESIRWIAVDERQRMDLDVLRREIERDLAAGHTPFLLVGTAGTVSTGAVDPLAEMASLARERGLWFHVDGAYGAFAMVAPGRPPEMDGMREADSIAVDPHKWLYSPLEAGCILVRDRTALTDAFRYTPPYYHFTDEEQDPRVNFYEYGMQNSRGFRALKVWLGLRQVGRSGYERMIADDIRLARELHRVADEHPELEARTCGLSIATFRFVPEDLEPGPDDVEAYLDELNEKLLGRLMDSGEVFVTNAVVGGRFLLRACIVNFRTALEDVRALPGIVVRHGRETDREARPENLR